MSDQDQPAARAGAWSHEEQTRFFLLAMNQLLENSTASIDLKVLAEKMPGRTPKALSHKWAAIKCDLAKVKDDPTAALASTPRKKKAEGDTENPSPAKKPRAKKAPTKKEPAGKEPAGKEDPTAKEELAAAEEEANEELDQA